MHEELNLIREMNRKIDRLSMQVEIRKLLVEISGKLDLVLSGQKGMTPEEIATFSKQMTDVANRITGIAEPTT